MTRWWKGVAVFAAWLSLGVATQAQQETPTPVGAARMIEPLRYKPEPQPDLVPGPVTPLVAPPGPPDCLSLPSGHSSAFQCENYTTESAFFGSAGGFGLARYHPGSLPIAFNDSPNITDTGRIPAGPLTVAQDLKDLNPGVSPGVRAQLGYLYADQSIELLGFYQPPSSFSKTITGAGQFFVPFTGPNGSFPLGFEGDNGLWKQADLVKVSYLTAVGGAELNYRTWNSAVFGVELILGVRYLYTHDRLNVLTDDDFLAKDLYGHSDPTKAATYSVGTTNNIVGPQVGWEYSTPCPIPCMGWLWFTGMGKAAVGANWVERNFNLSRGDGYQAFNVSRNNVQTGQVYELDAFLDMHVMERLRLRVGYTALWAVGVSNPAYQFQFDFSQQPGRSAEQGSALWHGPVAEIEFLW